MRPVVDALGVVVVRRTPAVAFITPTLDRPETHEHFYKTFAAQTVAHKRLYVLDESATPSQFFRSLGDPRVTYVHAPSPRGEVTRIGAARNKLYAMVGEPVVAWLDDDDHYQPDWAETMIGKMGDADVAKLVVWNSVLPSGDIYQWDTRQMGGVHFAIKGDEPPARVDVPNADPTFADAMLDGFGFSYVTRRSAWQRAKFNEEGTEDYPWIKRLRTLGSKIVHVADYPEGVLHTVHPKSASMVFPQRFLGHRRNLGLGYVSGMTELPRGQAIQIKPGVKYSLIASVKKKHTLKQLAARCATWGVVVSEMQDNVDGKPFGVAQPGGDYRLIHVTATAKTANTMPWSVPAPLSWFDASSVVRAWASEAQLGAVVRSNSMVGSRPMFAARPVAPQLGLTTPGDVLSYRAMWNDYVMQTACALAVQAWAATQLAAGNAAASIDLTANPCAAPKSTTNPNGQGWGTNVTSGIFDTSTFVTPPTPSVLTTIAQSSQSLSDGLVAEWNLAAGQTDYYITENAASILQSLQQTVLNVGQTLRPTLAQNSPGLLAALAEGPSHDLQAQLIASIEGAGILAHGVLKIVELGADGFVTGIKDAGQSAKSALQASISPWLWVPIAVIAASAATVTVVYAFKKSPAATAVARTRQLAEGIRR